MNGVVTMSNVITYSEAAEELINVLIKNKFFEDAIAAAQLRSPPGLTQSELDELVSWALLDINTRFDKKTLALIGQAGSETIECALVVLLEKGWTYRALQVAKLRRPPGLRQDELDQLFAKCVASYCDEYDEWWSRKVYLKDARSLAKLGVSATVLDPFVTHLCGRGYRTLAVWFAKRGASAGIKELLVKWLLKNRMLKDIKELGVNGRPTRAEVEELIAECVKDGRADQVLYWAKFRTERKLTTAERQELCEQLLAKRSVEEILKYFPRLADRKLSPAELHILAQHHKWA